MTIEEMLTQQLSYIGEDPTRDGLKDTPSRIIRSWEELFRGYSQDPKELLKKFEMESYNYDQMVLLRDIEMYSMCEHHMLPFLGRAHVAYLPNKNVLGISKLARLVDVFARRLQIQERIGEQVTSFLMENVGCLGAACVIKAEHLCMRMRGCSKQNSTMITSSLKGVFLEDLVVRQEFYQLIGGAL